MSNYRARKAVIGAIQKKFGTVSEYAKSKGLTKSAMNERLQKLSYKSLYELRRDGIVDQKFIDWYFSDQKTELPTIQQTNTGDGEMQNIANSTFNGGTPSDVTIRLIENLEAQNKFLRETFEQKDKQLSEVIASTKKCEEEIIQVKKFWEEKMREVFDYLEDIQETLQRKKK